MESATLFCRFANFCDFSLSLSLSPPVLRGAVKTARTNDDEDNERCAMPSNHSFSSPDGRYFVFVKLEERKKGNGRMKRE